MEKFFGYRYYQDTVLLHKVFIALEQYLSNEYDCDFVSRSTNILGYHEVLPLTRIEDLLVIFGSYSLIYCMTYMT